MKHLLLFSCLIVSSLIFYSCKNGNANRISKSDVANFTSIQWIDSTYNFGKVKFGDKVNIEYKFKNSGDKPLYILDVQPTCGCTVADYSKNAVMPNQQGFIKAVYDSHHGYPGAVQKSIIVTSNAKNSKNFVLVFKGEVVK